MAIVNVDLSEYDAIRKRNSELEEQVKELKELNDSLKQNAKVILRKETVVVERTLRRRSFFDELKICHKKMMGLMRTDAPLSLLSLMLTSKMSA